MHRTAQNNDHLPPAAPPLPHHPPPSGTFGPAACSKGFLGPAPPVPGPCPPPPLLCVITLFFDLTSARTQQTEGCRHTIFRGKGKGVPCCKE